MHIIRHQSTLKVCPQLFLLKDVSRLVQHLQSPFTYSQTNNDFLNVLGDLLQRGGGHLLEEADHLAELVVLSEVLELIPSQVTQVITLGKELVNVHLLVPDQVLHIMCETNFGGQAFGAFKVVDMLKSGNEIGDSENVL